MNLRRGILRFSLAFLILWGGFWTWTYFDAGKKSAEAADTMDFYFDWRLRNFDYEPEAGLARKNYGVLTEEAESAMARRDAEWSRQESAFNYGVWGVAGYLILVLALSWVWAGFRPTVPNPNTSRGSRLKVSDQLKAFFSRTTEHHKEKLEERHTVEKPRTKFMPTGLATVALIVSPYNVIANVVAGRDLEVGPLMWHYLVAFIQSIVIYGIAFTFQNRTKRTTTTKGGVHQRSLIITLIIITLLAYGTWYGRSKGESYSAAFTTVDVTQSPQRS